jgi:3-(methylsulfanyl)propanoyl-CoA dehydrogenase
MDLMGRKLLISEGAPCKAFLSELQSFCARTEAAPSLGEHVQLLARVAEKLKEMADSMRNAVESDPLEWASKTYAGLMCFAESAMVWRLLDMAAIAQKKIDEGGASDFYAGKVMQAKYFADVTLPILHARAEMCMRPSREVIEMPQDAF